ncbi:MAG: ATP-binding protein [Candidatus Pacebacteria bacterium]|nr:ATP-binding protein [Candidatus Paceibacterota bacterium]
MNLYGISSILTGITSLAMAVFVYIRGRKNKLALIWSAFAASASFYGFGAFMVTSANNSEQACFWWQLAYIGIILLPFLFVLLAYEFLNIRRPWIIKILGFCTFIFLAANFFFRNLFIKGCSLYFTDMPSVKPIYFVYPGGPLLYVFILFAFFGWVTYAHLELIINYRRISILKRHQIKYFFFAAALGFIGGGASFLPCFGISFYPLLNFAVPLYFIIMSYAIMRYHLIDIKVAITRTGIFIAVYTLVLGVPFAVTAWLKNWLVGIFGANWVIFPLGLMVILATAGPFIYIYLQRKAEEKLLREQRSYQDILRQTAMGMTRIHNLQQLLDLIANAVTANVHISHSAVYLYDADSGKFSLKSGSNLRSSQPNSIDRESLVINWIRKEKKALVYEEIRQSAIDDPDLISKKIVEDMRELGAAIIIPSFLEEKLLSLLVLGDKFSGKIYTLEDLNIFSILANQTALAIESALLYENIEEQVRRRTKELLEVQKQLVHAEKLATVGTLAGGVAHEINNPLTAVLTNVQMLLSLPNSLDADSKESLELIEEATKRCRTIVQKLMAYAKKPLESVPPAKTVDMFHAVLNVVTFLKYQLEQENIKIVTQAKEGEYLVTGNQSELEQVLTNIILNARDAIRQVKKGGLISISFSKDSKSVKVGIKDDGPGISKEITHKIFDPFFSTKDVGKGTGLGLSICQAIIEKHNGSISVESEAGKGATFTISIPVVELKKEGRS